MKVLSVNVGLPRDVQIDDRTVATGIYKVPITERVRVRILNLDGDRQADLTVHGGTDKAVYAYPSEHYAFWRNILGEDLSWGAFGENLTIEGLSEETGRIVLAIIKKCLNLGPGITFTATDGTFQYQSPTEGIVFHSRNVIGYA